MAASVNILGLIIGLVLYASYILLFRVFPEYVDTPAKILEEKFHVHLHRANVTGSSALESCTTIASALKIHQQHGDTSSPTAAKLVAKWNGLDCSMVMANANRAKAAELQQQQQQQIEPQIQPMTAATTTTDHAIGSNPVDQSPSPPAVGNSMHLPATSAGTAIDVASTGGNQINGQIGLGEQQTESIGNKKNSGSEVVQQQDTTKVKRERDVWKKMSLLPAETKSCLKAMRKYQVLPGKSWGNLPTALQRKWSTAKCDELVESIDPNILARIDELKPAGSAGVGKVDAFVAGNVDTSSVVQAHHAIDGTSHKPKTVDQAGLPRIKEEFKDWCGTTKDKFSVQPMKSWGSLPMNLIEVWKERKCDLVFTSNRMASRPVSSCLGSSLGSQSNAPKSFVSGGGFFSSLTGLLSKNATSTSALPPDSHPNLQANLPLIAILAGTTTRRVHHPSTSTMALFTYLLPSLIRSLNCGFRYEYVLGFDKGDPFYDTEAGMNEVKQWFKENIEVIMRQHAIVFTLRTVRVHNTIKKPGPVFIEMARAAYNAGADYFFRVNDDTEILSDWPKMFVKALHSLPPPYGVVGPLCQQGNQNILTHDFVHRVHMEVFDMNYYPPELTDWWMDDWISWVYGQSRTFRAKQHAVIHHTSAHGQRYEVDRSHERLLEGLVKKGREKIRAWMLKHNADNKVLQAFDGDLARPGYHIKDIPRQLY